MRLKGRMNLIDQIETGRLLLRSWNESDIDPFCAMNADKRVMEFFPGVLSREETLGMVQRILDHFEQNGFGLWAVELPETRTFIGFVGLQRPRFEAAFTPCVEIGWRLAAEYWGQGLATEAAKEVLSVGFNQIGLSEIVSMTAVINTRSRRVMEKIGMEYSEHEDFDHPRVPRDSHVLRHVLYRLRCDSQQTQSEN